MRKLGLGIITVILLQFMFVSCEAEDQEFNANVEQIQNDLQAVNPSHAGGGDTTDDEEDGSS